MLLKCRFSVYVIVALGFAASPRLRAERLSADGLFESAHLLDVQIEIPAEDWQALCLQTRSFAEALSKPRPPRPFTYFSGNITIDGQEIKNVGIRKKGFIGSLDHQRPSLKIKFDEFQRQDPIANLDRLTLNNNKQDRSLVSQFLTYSLFNDAGLPAPRSNFARVTVNGQNLGIYSHVESVKGPFLRRTFGDDDGLLDEGTLADFFADHLDAFETKTNDKDERHHLKNLADLLDQDELKWEELERVVDIDAFLRFWAIESLIGFWDGYTNNQNNFFVYQNPANSQLYFIPWGADSAFTSTGNPFRGFSRSAKSVHAKARLPHRLFQFDEMKQRYKQTLRNLLETQWHEERLLAKVNQAEGLVADHVHERQDDFAKAMNQKRSFIKKRRGEIMQELKTWPVKVDNEPRQPPYFREIGHASGTFATQWQPKSPPEPYELGDATIELTLNGTPVQFTRLGVSTEPSPWGSGGFEPGRPDPNATKPPALVFKGKQKSNGKRLTLTVVMQPEFFGANGKPAAVQGMLSEGLFWGFNLSTIRMIGGTVTFKQAQMKPDAEVRGSFEFKIVQMQGGFQ